MFIILEFLVYIHTQCTIAKIAYMTTDRFIFVYSNKYKSCDCVYIHNSKFFSDDLPQPQRRLELPGNATCAECGGVALDVHEKPP